jgi:hypothetical protein
MNIKKLIPVFAIAMGLVLAMVTSGFKEEPKGNQNPYFYEYRGSDFSNTNIQKPTNYIRASESCSGSLNVCGVYLNVDTGQGNPANSTDFSSESSNLLTSQQNHAPADGNIKMKS